MKNCLTQKLHDSEVKYSVYKINMCYNIFYDYKNSHNILSLQNMCAR